MSTTLLSGWGYELADMGRFQRAAGDAPVTVKEIVMRPFRVWFYLPSGELASTTRREAFGGLPVQP